jgi:excisionase family DNA binding protein
VAGVENLLDKRGAAKRLGTTPRHMEDLVRDRKVPFVRVGRLIRFKPSDLDQWIEDQKVEAID